MAIPEAADLQALAATNQAQADNIVAAGTADKRPGCRKEIVENLLEVFEEALEFTGRKMKVINTGYEGEFNIATSAMDKLAELKNRHNNLQAQLVIMGPGQESW
ncbi:unnamed protein product [Effrenium voratum]|nr:unnamed protein product [Effrenium voratum]